MTRMCCSGEIKTRDGTEKPCVLKCLPCTTVREHEVALNELEALYMGRGVPHLVQGLAAFQCYDPNRQAAVIWLATESAPPHLPLPASALPCFA